MIYSTYRVIHIACSVYVYILKIYTCTCLPPMLVGIPSMKTALLVGGLPIAQQLHRLNNNVQVNYTISIASASGMLEGMCATSDTGIYFVKSGREGLGLRLCITGMM